MPAVATPLSAGTGGGQGARNPEPGAPHVLCRVCAQPLAPAQLLAALPAQLGGGCGALASFLGQVRGERGACTGLWVEAHPGLIDADLRRLAETACRHWGLAAVEIHHRTGLLAPGEPIVLVMAAAAHRAAAQQACAWLADGLKSQASLWKKELRPGGDRWLEPSDDDRKRWRDWLLAHPELAAASWDPALRHGDRESRRATLGRGRGATAAEARGTR